MDNRNLTKAKVTQAEAIVKELDIDLWLTINRESDIVPDPVTDLIVGQKLMWLSCFFITKQGRSIALVGSAEAANLQRSKLYDEIVVYGSDVGIEVKKLITEINPRSIAVNYSKDDCTADGLSHGLFLQLQEWLKGTVYGTNNTILSAQPIIAKLRSRKIPAEIERLERSAALANQCWYEMLPRIRPGMSEIEIAAALDERIRHHGCTPSFETIVNAGAKSEAGHGTPTNAILEPGDLLHMDFGVKIDGYCSDLQRVAYVPRTTPAEVPTQLTAAFAQVRAIIEQTTRLYKPGAIGVDIDTMARTMLSENGYPHFDHALGHQIGRAVHDGAAVVGPAWKRYGTSTSIALEEGNCFTVELGIAVEKIGYVGLEEDLVVTASGGRFLCPAQTELVIIERC
ncbi:MAG: aminopeptidase P family protein [Chitinivibrionales bacterium]|nr:aminopeptidase P family protein [Chitinivibrionales bacterium]